MSKRSCNLLATYGVAVLATAVGLSSATVATADIKNWNAGTGNWNVAGNWTPVGVPGTVTVDSVNIVLADGVSRTIAYDYTGPAVTLTYLLLDLTGPGATTTTLSMSANNLTSRGMTVGFNGRGALNQSAGTTTLSFGGDLVLGDNTGSSGTYNLSGIGSLSVSGSENIGDSGTGTFNQTGGTNTANFNLYLGFFANGTGTGTYTISGGSATFSAGTFVGGAGTGILDVSGTGVFTAGNTLSVDNTPGSVVNLSGGTINTAALNFNGVPAHFNWTGGKLNLTSSVTWDPNVSPTSTSSAFGSALTLGNNQTLVITGNETLGNLGSFALTLNSGSVHQVTGTLTINPTSTLTINAGSALSYSTLTQAGGTVNGTLQNQGNFVYQSGQFNGRLLNQGTLSLGPSFTAGNGIENDTSLTVNSGQSLTANGAGLQNKGTLSLSGGTINASALSFHGSPAAFNWSSGTLNLTSSVIWDSAAEHTATSAAFGSQLVLGNNRTLTITGDETLGGAGTFHLRLNSGSTHNVTGNLIIGPTGTLTQNLGSNLNAPDITLAGGIIDGDGFVNNFVLTGHGTLAGDGGFFNSGSVTVSGGTLTISNSGFSTNAELIDIPAGHQLLLAGGGLDNVGTIKLNGGMIGGTALFGNTAGIISGYGTIASLIINSGLLVADAGVLRVNSAVTSNGEISLTGGLAMLSGSGTISNIGLIRGDGVVSKLVNNNAGGEIRAENGKRIKLAGANGANAGQINLQGGTAEFAQALTNAAAGQVIGRGTIMVGGAGLTNQGHVAFSSGISDVFGDVTNNTGAATRGISVSGNADATFWDDVTNVAGSLFRVSAGSSATFFGTFAGAGITGTGDVYFEADVTPGASPAIAQFGGNVNLGSTSALNVELGGTTAGAQYDQLLVAGALALGGALDVSLINGFVPSAGQAFNILDWGSLTGTFSTIQLPTLAGTLAWNTSQLYTTGVLSVAAAGLLGDYNQNGIVDAADYTLWRNNLGSGTSLANDDTPGVGPDDYSRWRARFGQMAGAGGGSALGPTSDSAVPEPASITLTLIGGLAFVLASARQREGAIRSAMAVVLHNPR